MSSTPTTTNSSLSLSDTAIQAMIDVAMGAIEAELKAQFPLLAAPIIGDVLDFITKELENLEAAQLEKMATFAIVDYQTTSEQSAVVTAAGVLAAAQATGNTDAINSALANFKSCLGSLIHYDGS